MPTQLNDDFFANRMQKEIDERQIKASLEKRLLQVNIALRAAATVLLTLTSVLVAVMIIFFIGLIGKANTPPATDSDTIKINQIARDMSNAVSDAVSNAATNKAGSIPLDTMYVDEDSPDSPKEGTPYGGHPNTTQPMPYVVTVDDSCYNDGQAWIYVAGLTPYGNYTVQTDWSHMGSFGYGDGAYVNSYGQATYAWPCSDVQHNLLPSNTYRVLITDRTSGFAIMINIVVGDTPYYNPDPRVPTYYVAKTHGK